MTDLDRYHRQMLLPGIGETGQRRLAASRVLIVGCGALGSVIADCLARAGVGRLRIVDRDVVELTNLQRQVLYTEDDVARAMPKAEAARAAIARINGQVEVEARVEDFDHRNAERHAEGADAILDGLDNFETRYLLNDLAVSRGLPYVYGGAVGTTGMSFTVLPHPRHRRGPATSAVRWTESESTACLRCVFPEAPPAGSTPTCDTAGVLGPVVAMVAAHQSAQALKLLTGNLDALDRRMLTIDAWSNEHRGFDLGPADAEGCPCCGRGRLEHLEGGGGSRTTSLCGRNAVQVVPPDRGPGDLDLEALAGRLAAHGRFVHNGFLLHGRFDGERDPEGRPVELTLFPDGRAILKGTTEPETARSIYAKYIGS
ncbi:MAG: ThiF family adenylyltransferase [Planctomycetota bacterium]|jgi:adenylyltransferase/sulfurtransferase